MNSKEKILNRISEALKNKSDLRATDNSVDEKINSSLKAITPKDNPSLWLQFKTELEKISGEYNSFNSVEECIEYICTLLKELNISTIGIDCAVITKVIQEKLKEKGIKIIDVSKLKADDKKKTLAGINCAVTGPSFAVADIGSLVFTMDDTGTSYPHYLCDNTIAVIKRESIAANQFELFEKLNPEKSNNMFFVTGPSRTADIEKVLVLGAHGPRRLIVISID